MQLEKAGNSATCHTTDELSENKPVQRRLHSHKAPGVVRLRASTTEAARDRQSLMGAAAVFQDESSGDHCLTI